MTTSHVKEYVKRVASIDQEAYPCWNLQKPLPKLPVPDLHSTLEKYTAMIKPIVSEKQHQVTQQIVAEFGRKGGNGEYLQEKLKSYAETKDNWAYNWWLDEMYMKVRLPLPVNSNPAMAFPRQYFEDQYAQLRYASRLISGILDYKTIIDARGLPIDRARHREKGQPLCMEQYYRLFTSYRVPGRGKDSLVVDATSILPEPEHIVVICKNQFFVLDVVINFLRLTQDNLFTQLSRIVKMAEENERNSDPIGILSSLDRDQWATSRMRLMEESTNRDSLDLIERCIFVLCLDSSVPIAFNHQSSVDETSMSMRDDVSLASQMLHGMGSRINSCNRWFDKTMQFVIGEDGACGLNYEHSPSEGIAVVQLIEHLLKYMEEVRKRRLPRMQSICELPYPRKLRWKVTPEILEDISVAKLQIDRLIKNLDLYVLRFNKFGREFPKTQNMSPDSFIQLALQLTYYKVHGRLVSTYESASTRRFLLGRVDNIRACSPPALEWVKAMTGQTEATDDEKMKLLRKAMDWQTDIMIQTILGHGIDCHLMGLREMANELNFPAPEIFSDSSYISNNQFTLSTSQVPTTMDDAFMCYGPVVHNGYGVCYNPHPHNLLVCVSSFHSSAESGSDFFALTLESSFLQMYELCMKIQNGTTDNYAKQPANIVPNNGAASSGGSQKQPVNGVGNGSNCPKNGLDSKQPCRNGNVIADSPRRNKLTRQKENKTPDGIEGK